MSARRAAALLAALCGALLAAAWAERWLCDWGALDGPRATTAPQARHAGPVL